MTSNREFFLHRHKAERKAFAAVLEAVPDRGRDYRPDPKARTGGDLAWLLAYEEEILRQVLETGHAEWTDTKAPDTVAEIVAAYERAASALDAVVAGLDDEAWEKKVKLVMGGAPWEETRSRMAWGFLFDGIHHRGQLSAYLRPMGGRVPAIYGPSADDPGR